MLPRVLFYGGNLVVVTIICQGWFEDLVVSIFGDTTGQSLYDFIRTNVEAPISAIFLALFLDLVLRHRPAPAVDAHSA